MSSEYDPAIQDADERVRVLTERVRDAELRGYAHGAAEVARLREALTTIAQDTVIDRICREYPAVKRLQGLARDALGLDEEDANG
jgi:hypothetical protein